MSVRPRVLVHRGWVDAEGFLLRVEHLGVPTARSRVLQRWGSGTAVYAHGDDLLLHFDDLVARDGASCAWRRTLLDLMITVPRYRLESVMNTRRTTATLIAMIAALALATVTALTAGVGPIALIALAAAVVLAVARRGGLGRSVHSDGAEHDRILRWAALLGVCCAATLAIGLIDLGGRDSWPSGRLLAYNATFVATGFAAVACLAIGVRRRRAIATHV